MVGIKRIKGKSKRDVLRGTKGKDHIVGLSGNDFLKGLGGNDRIFGDKGNDRLLGGAGNDKIFGRAGNDILEGGTGKDTLVGGKDNDIYIINDAQDTIQERVGQGIDTVQAAIDYVLGANLENLTLTGSQNLKATGNDLVNIITGNTGNNTLDGRGGADKLIGGLGDDIFIVDNQGDVVIEEVNGGIDTVRTTLSTYTRPINVEFIEFIGTGSFTATGGNSNNTITGGKSNDTLNGGGGNDTLNGGGGGDTMNGGSGNDTYVVDNASDLIKETVDGGTDLVKSTIDYVLTDGIENLELVDGAIKGVGNDLANLITGTTGNNILDGGLGADKLVGGLGDDTYIVDNALDFVDETTGGGVDLVKSTVDYVLGDGAENLELLGDRDLKGTGDDLANTITGNAGNNILKGGNGNDTLIGGDGLDTLIGGTGVDTLTGGNGVDTFVFDTLDGDTIKDFDATKDVIALNKTAFALSGLLGSALGADSFITVADDAAAQAFGVLAPIVYSAGSGKLFYNQNGLASGFGSGGVIANIADTTGTAPALSSANIITNSII